MFKKEKSTSKIRVQDTHIRAWFPALHLLSEKASGILMTKLKRKIFVFTP